LLACDRLRPRPATRALRDEIGIRDLHATILHLLGFDHTLLTYSHGGRDMRLSDVHGRVVRDLLA
jgi:hypothetical protein